MSLNVAAQGKCKLASGAWSKVAARCLLCRGGDTSMILGAMTTEYDCTVSLRESDAWAM